MTSIERRVSEDLRVFADITIDERDVMNAQQQLRERVAVATRRRGRTRLVLAAAAVVIVAAVAGAWWLTGSDSRTATPADSSTVPDQSPKAVATRFVEAYAAYDVQRVSSMLAPGVGVSGLADSPDNWIAANRFGEVTGEMLFLDPCTKVSSGSSGTTMNCPFDYHALHSADVGRGPFSGSSFLVTVDEGEIMAAFIDWKFLTNQFSSEMWEPFAAWVSKEYPRDAAVMYADWPGTDQQSYSDESISLWQLHTQGYVDHVRQTAGATPE